MSQDSTPYASSATSLPDSDPEVITSVADFIAKIVQVKQERGVEFFYRGHADIGWKLQPSIFRFTNVLEKEDLLFRDMVAHMPQSFSECKTTLDYLVQMQHYELPTRLLDVTTNPLVALYFACVQQEHVGKKNLEGVIRGAFAGANLHTASKDATESVAIGMTGAVAGALAATAGWTEESAVIVARGLVGMLCERNGEHSEEILAKATEVATEAAKLGSSTSAEVNGRDGVVYLFSVPVDKVKHYDSDRVSVLANLAKCKISKECLALSSLESFNEQPDIRVLLSQIKEEKPYFQPLIRYEDLTSLFLVKAKNSNQRIINQMGAFFLFGLGRYRPKEGSSAETTRFFLKRTRVEVPTKWIKRNFIIPRGDIKTKILRELAQIGITESYLFPEMDKYAKELQAKYGGLAK